MRTGAPIGGPENSLAQGDEATKLKKNECILAAQLCISVSLVKTVVVPEQSAISQVNERDSNRKRSASVIIAKR